MIVLGLDPGSNITGYGIVQKQGSQLIHVDNGCLTTKRSQTLPERLHSIHQSLREVIQKHKPDCMAIEEVFFAKNVSSSLRLGEARGVALLAAAQEGLEIFEYSTRVVKQALTGFGQAQKEQVQKMVQKLLKLPEVAQIDASDALALAICHSNTYKIRSS